MTFHLCLLYCKVTGIFRPKSGIDDVIQKLRDFALCSSLGPEVSASLPSSLCLSESPYVCFMSNIQAFHLYLTGWIGKSMSTPIFWKQKTPFLSFLKNWITGALQHYVSFCCTMKWISYMYTYVPSPLHLPPTTPPHPSRSSQSSELSSPCYSAGSREPFILHVVVHWTQKHGRTCFECQSSRVNQLFPVGCDEYQSSRVDPQGVLGRDEAVKGKEPG